MIDNPGAASRGPLPETIASQSTVQTYNVNSNAGLQRCMGAAPRGHRGRGDQDAGLGVDLDL
jgi:hypothetical protein